MTAKISNRGGILPQRQVATRAVSPRVIKISVRRVGDSYHAHTGGGEARVQASSTNQAFYAALSVAEKIFGVGRAKVLGKDHERGKCFRAIESVKEVRRV